MIFDPGANESMRVDENDVTIDATTKIKNGKVIKSSSATECGFQVGNESLTVGTEGSIIGPIFSGTTLPSDTTLDTEFGNVDGAIAVWHDTDAPASSAGLLLFRVNGTWYKISGTKIN